MAQSGEGGENDGPELLNETLSVKVSAAQKRDVVMVAALEKSDISTLLRENSVNEILARAGRFREQHQAASA